MPRQIIILETNPGDGGMVAIRCAMWFPITAGQEVPLSGFSSSFKTKGAVGPTAQEVTDLQDGKVVEEVRSIQFPKSFTSSQIRGSLVAAYVDRLAFRATLPNTGQFYGTAYDGTAWV